MRAVAAGDLTHADAVATQLQTTSLGLHAHHEGEDERLWSALEERAPACAAHVERMKEQHAVMLVHLGALDAALPAWRASAAPADAAPVLTALDGINDALAVHLPDEEQNIVPGDGVHDHAEGGRLVFRARADGLFPKGRRGISSARSWPRSPMAATRGSARTCRRRRGWRGGGSAGRPTRSTAPRWRAADSGEPVLEGEHDQLHPVAQARAWRGSG